MARRRSARVAARWLVRIAALGAGAYAAHAGMAWWRYGRPAPPPASEHDELLDRFMPVYDVVERHSAHVDAAPAATLQIASAIDMADAAVVRAIFRGRELLLGAAPPPPRRFTGLLAEVQSLGWVILDEAPGREVVVGTVTRPWEADVVFRSVPPAAFAAFAEPGYVKIAWTLRVDADGAAGTIFRTETRAAATDAVARSKFRRYWALLSPGIIVIRRMITREIRAEAERRQPPRADGGTSGPPEPGCGRDGGVRKAFDAPRL